MPARLRRFPTPRPKRAWPLPHFPNPLCCSIYKSPNTIVSPPDLSTPFKLSIAPDATGALRLTFSSGATSCSDGLAFIDPDQAPCPEGTFPEPNPPSAAAAALKMRQCWPCDAGVKCPLGTASEQECGQGTYSQLWGAAACLTCPPGTVSREGESQLARILCSRTAGLVWVLGRALQGSSMPCPALARGCPANHGMQTTACMAANPPGLPSHPLQATRRARCAPPAPTQQPTSRRASCAQAGRLLPPLAQLARRARQVCPPALVWLLSRLGSGVVLPFCSA